MQRINPKTLPQILPRHKFFSVTKKNYGRATFYSCLLALAVLSPGTHAVGLGNIDIRSYLGEPLNLRIGVITQANEEIDTNCFAVINAPGSEANVGRRDVRLTLVDTRNSRYLEVRGTNAFNEPIGRLSIRAGCQTDAGVVRDYSLLLDPAPLLAPATVNREPATKFATNAIQVESAQSPNKVNSAGNWTVYDGDTLSSIARGIHPSNPSRQAQYIAALRSLNPALADLADNAPLPLNSQLVLPDLKTLSSATARSGSRPGNVVSDDVAPAKKREPKAKTKRGETKASVGGARQTAAVANVALTPATLPTAIDRSAAAVNEEKKLAGKSPETKKPALADGFKLRISGGDLDLSRSQGITDETRTQLRERFAALDADDQTAQLLALKNTVKQIEKRLNEMQLKMATLPASGVAPVAQADAAAAAIASAPPALPATPPAAKPATLPKTPQPKIPDSREFAIDLTTFIVAALSALALAALAWWVLKRRSQASTLNGTAKRNENASSDEFNTWANDPETTSPSEATTKQKARTANKDRNLNRTDNAPEKNEVAGEKNRFAADGAARSLSANEPAKSAQISTQEHGVEADLAPGLKSTANSPGFTLPTDVFASPIQKTDPPRTSNTIEFAHAAAPGDTFDLDLDLDEQASTSSNAGDQISEDRLRRLRYMHERYPELAARTVSIDEPESVINAARLYHEDNQLGKACELLIYAVEERPQEIRFWLAQFELFRLEKMSPQFSDLANKFQLLFRDTNSWPKVRKIGFDLDPTNPLYAMGATAPEQFDPVSENWLNEPVGTDALTQNISEALIADLRASLFAEHRLTHADFARGPNLLFAMSERG